MWRQDRTLQSCVSRTKPSVRFRLLWIRLRDYDNIPLIKFQDRRSMIVKWKKKKEKTTNDVVSMYQYDITFSLLNFKETRSIIVKTLLWKGKNGNGNKDISQYNIRMYASWISTVFCHIKYEYTNKSTRRAKVTLQAMQAIKRNKTASTIAAGLSECNWNRLWRSNEKFIGKFLN